MATIPTDNLLAREKSVFKVSAARAAGVQALLIIANEERLRKTGYRVFPTTILVKPESRS